MNKFHIGQRVALKSTSPIYFSNREWGNVGELVHRNNPDHHYDFGFAYLDDNGEVHTTQVYEREIEAIDE